MHGVKRLFAWMIPRFDKARFNVSLVSLRKRDVSEETLDALGIEIEYLHRSKFDPATLTALLKIIDRRKVDVLHLHGYGATTFGRLAGAMRGLPTILHEHANLTDTPWFQKIADKLLEPYTDLAIAVSESTAEFVRTARLVRPERVKVVYLGAPLDEFGAERGPADDCRRTGGARHRPRRIRDRHNHAASRVQGKQLPRGRGRDGRPRAARGALLPGRRRTAPPGARGPGAGAGLGDRFVFVGFVKDVRVVLSAFDLTVFPSLWEGTPLTVFEALAMGKPIVATDADGLLDVLRADRDGAHRAEARCGRARGRASSG